MAVLVFCCRLSIVVLPYIFSSMSGILQSGCFACCPPACSALIIEPNKPFCILHSVQDMLWIVKRLGGNSMKKTSGFFFLSGLPMTMLGCIPAPQLCATARGHCASHRPSVDHSNRQRHSPVVPCGLANPSQSRNQQDLLCPAHHHCHVCSNCHRRFICSRRGGVDYGHRRHFGRYDHKPRQKRP